MRFLGRSSLELQHARAVNRFRLAWMEEAFDLAVGVMLEGSLQSRTVESRHLPPAAGFSFSEGGTTSRVLLLGVGAVGEHEAHVGRLEAPDGAAFAFSGWCRCRPSPCRPRQKGGNEEHSVKG